MRTATPTGWHFARPGLAEPYLRTLYLGMVSAIALHARRGMGKACKRSVYLEDGFVALCKRMLPADRLIVQAVAAGEFDLHGSRSLARIGKALRLGQSADRSVPQNALKRLRDRQILIHSDTGVYRFGDDTFKDWVLTERPRE
jgi:hypothetical protein